MEINLSEVPKKYKDHKRIGKNLILTFEGEQYEGEAILDTKISINEGPLCWISWRDKEMFTQEIQSIIDKYSI